MKTGALILKNKPNRRLTAPVCRTLAAVVAGVFPSVALAQPILEAVAAATISIVPRVSVSETYTSNVFLSSTDPQSELITRISPGIRISSTGGRIKGTLDYSLSELLYANNSSGRTSQNALNASANVEVVDKWAYVDLSGVISQQAISAFGVPSDNGALLSGNSTETSVFRISPYVRGRFAGVADYDARYSLSSSQSKSSLVSDVTTKDLTVRLTGVGGRFGLGWSLDVSHQAYDGAGRSTQAQRINGQVGFTFTTGVGFYVKGGHESTNLAGATGQQYNYTAFGASWAPSDRTKFSIDRDTNGETGLGASWTPNDELKLSASRDGRGATGLTVAWAPSKRTSLTVTREQRLFGETHSITVTHRTPSTAWTFSDSRSVVANPSQGPGIFSVSLYDVLFGQFAAGESDPAKREQYGAFLRSIGVTPNLTAVGGFLSSTVSLQRAQQLSFALFGARSTVSVVATRSQNTKLDNLSTAVDDFLTSSAVRQNGLSVNFSHRLTAKSVLSLVAARQSSSGVAGVAGTSSRTLNVSLATQLSPEISASLSARRVVFDSSTAPYTETAVIGNLNVQF